MNKKKEERKEEEGEKRDMGEKEREETTNHFLRDHHSEVFVVVLQGVSNPATLQRRREKEIGEEKEREIVR
jgi:hypothetical protein